VGELALDRRGSGDGVRGALKGSEESIPLGVNLDAPMSRERGAQ
jgi:hypothetical protein